jgi:hypothetical protein
MERTIEFRYTVYSQDENQNDEPKNITYEFNVPENFTVDNIEFHFNRFLASLGL